MFTKLDWTHILNLTELPFFLSLLWIVRTLKVTSHSNFQAYNITKWSHDDVHSILFIEIQLFGS